eukprot:g3046.t1
MAELPYDGWNQEMVDMACGRGPPSTSSSPGSSGSGIDVAVLSARASGLNTSQIAALQSCGTKVVCYISLGEDGRSGIPYARRKDGTGGEVGGEAAQQGLRDGSMEYVSYYMDGNLAGKIKPDGKPDRNNEWGGYFVNASDPAWWDTLVHERIRYNEKGAWDGFDGLDVLLRTPRNGGKRDPKTWLETGGFECDGVFLDTLDTAAPTTFEVGYGTTAPAMVSLIRRIRKEYPGKAIVANRGLFFFQPEYRQTFDPTFGGAIDALVYESYQSDSDATHAASPYKADNRHRYTPKVMAQANLFNFHVIALEYRKELMTPALEREANLLIMRTLGWSLCRTDRNVHSNDYFDARKWLLNHGGFEDIDPPTWENTHARGVKIPELSGQLRFVDGAGREGVQRVWATPEQGGKQAALHLAWDPASDQTWPIRFNVYVQAEDKASGDGSQQEPQRKSRVYVYRHVPIKPCEDWGRTVNAWWDPPGAPTTFPHCFSTDDAVGRKFGDRKLEEGGLNFRRGDRFIRCGRTYRVWVRAEDGNGLEDANTKTLAVTTAAC